MYIFFRGVPEEGESALSWRARDRQKKGARRFLFRPGCLCSFDIRPGSLRTRAALARPQPPVGFAPLVCLFVCVFLFVSSSSSRPPPLPSSSPLSPPLPYFVLSVVQKEQIQTTGHAPLLSRVSPHPPPPSRTQVLVLVVERVHARYTKRGGETGAAAQNSVNGPPTPFRNKKKNSQSSRARPFNSKQKQNVTTTPLVSPSFSPHVLLYPIVMIPALTSRVIFSRMSGSAR